MAGQINKSKETFRINRDVAVIMRSRLFDYKYYREQYKDEKIKDLIHHYVTIGSKDNKNPNQSFNTEDYIKNNPDVVKHGFNPFAYWIRYGKKAMVASNTLAKPSVNGKKALVVSNTLAKSSVNENINTNINTDNVTKDDLCFIIVKYTTSPLQYEIYENSLRSIRNIYKYAKIVVVDDHSPNNYYSIPSAFKNDDNISIEKTKFPRSGEFSGYYHYHQGKYAKRAVVMHDSMFLLRPIDKLNEINIKFLWHFEKNKIEYNNNCVEIIRKFTDPSVKKELYGLFSRRNQHRWQGCFGVASIISYDYLDDLQKKTNFLEIVKHIKCRKDRMAMERIFGMVNFKYGGSIDYLNCSINGSIFKHPKKGMLHFNYKPNTHINLNEIQSQFQNYNSCMIKTWHGR